MFVSRLKWYRGIKMASSLSLLSRESLASMKENPDRNKNSVTIIFFKLNFFHQNSKIQEKENGTDFVFPVDAGRKLNMHKTFRRRPRFNLRPVSTGLLPHSRNQIRWSMKAYLHRQIRILFYLRKDFNILKFSTICWAF